MADVPAIRIGLANTAPVAPGGDFVLYWMTAARRVTWNFALQRAVEWARRLRKPLAILEDLRSGDRWDSRRSHRFVLDGMAETARRLKGKPVLYYPHVERNRGAAADLVPAISRRAAVIVTDEFPCSIWPGVVADAADRAAVRVERVDSNGLLPQAEADRVFVTAFSFRAFLQKQLPPHLEELPASDPLARVRLPRLRSLPAEVTRRWPQASEALLAGDAEALAALPIEQNVAPVETPGGTAAAEARLREFLADHLPRYVEDRNHPDLDATSGLAPYLHFGHISAHQIFSELMRQEGWTAARLGKAAGGKREGWWGVSGCAEAFLDQLVTWREIGYNFCLRRADYDRYESLPAWARRTLAAHARDRRPYVYSRELIDGGRTHDRLWNAAQTQLVREGRLHNYMRMLWGKKILEWSRSAGEAVEMMIDLNNRYALDGRNPNSYSGILWVLGRYDRAWGPERPIFGTVRYMSSESTLRKLRVRKYLACHAPERSKS